MSDPRYITFKTGAGLFRVVDAKYGWQSRLYLQQRDAVALRDWLNEREAGYPIKSSVFDHG